MMAPTSKSKTIDSRAMAEIIRRLSTKRGDTILAQITPKEAALLKAVGGAGKKDPKTGVMHYWQANDSDKESDSESESGSSSDSSSDSGSGSGSNTDHGTLSGGGIGDGSSNQDSFVDASSDDTGRSLSMRDGGGFTKTPEERESDAQAARDSYMNALGVSQGAQSTEGTYKTGYSAVSESLSGPRRFWAGVVGGLSGIGALGSGLVGDFGTAASLGVSAYGNLQKAIHPNKVTVLDPGEPANTGKPAVSTDETTSRPATKGNTESRADRDNTAKTAPVKTNPMDPSAGFIAGVHAAWSRPSATPAPDPFTSAPRSREGYSSTRLGSGYGLTPLQKRLLGV